MAVAALAVWMSRDASTELPPPPPFDVAARRATLAESTAQARDGAFARVSWGAAAGATAVSLGEAAPVEIPVVDGRAVASIGILADADGKRSYVMLTVSVFAGERRLFGSTLNKRDAAGVGAEPMTVRVEGFDAAGRYPGREHEPGPGTFGEARLVIAEP